MRKNKTGFFSKLISRLIKFFKPKQRTNKMNKPMNGSHPAFSKATYSVPKPVSVKQTGATLKNAAIVPKPKMTSPTLKKMAKK